MPKRGTKLLALAAVVLVGVILIGVTHWTTARLLRLELDETLRHESQHLHAHLAGTIEGLLLSPRILGQMDDVQALLRTPSPERVLATNTFLEHFAKEVRGETVYLLNRDGVTLASSNWRSDKSFVGQSYAFRPYFQQAMAGGDGFYVAQGVTSGTIGLYISRPVMEKTGLPLGVAVVKYSAPILLERFMNKNKQADVLLIEENGIIFSATSPEWLARPTRFLDATSKARIASARIFSEQVLNTPSLLPDSSRTTPWLLNGEEEFFTLLTPPADTQESSRQPQRGLFTPLPSVTGWQLGILRPDKINQRDMFSHFLVNSLLVLALYLATLLLLAFLWERRTHLARMNILMRHVPVAVALFDRDMNYLHASHRWLDDHNLDPNATLGKNHYHLLPQQPERWKEIHRKTLEGHWQHRDAEPFLLPDGETQWTTWESFPIRSPRGRVTGIILYIQDVTSQVVMQNEIKLQRNKLAFEREFIERIILKMRSNKGFSPGILRYLLAPLEKTAGDILLAAPRPDGVRHTLLGDFTGHGLTAALAGPLVADIFYSMTAKGLSLQAILAEINQKLHMKLPTGLFMTLCCLEHSPAPSAVRVWNWNMPEVLHCRAGRCIASIASHHFASGIVAHTNTSDWKTLEIQPGDRIYMVSDGTVEIKNRAGERLGQERMNEMLTAFSGETLPLETLAWQLAEFRGDLDQGDDLTLVELPC